MYDNRPALVLLLPGTKVVLAIGGLRSNVCARFAAKPLAAEVTCMQLCLSRSAPPGRLRWTRREDIGLSLPPRETTAGLLARSECSAQHKCPRGRMANQRFIAAFSTTAAFCTHGRQQGMRLALTVHSIDRADAQFRQPPRSSDAQGHGSAALVQEQPSRSSCCLGPRTSRLPQESETVDAPWLERKSRFAMLPFLTLPDLLS